MRIAIMQPYFFPYIGYFQLIKSVDEFVIYDNIEFTKKGWINRNRILENGVDVYITLPLKKDSDYLDVRERHLVDDWSIKRVKILNKIVEAYRKAPEFNIVYPLIEKCINFDVSNLFWYVLNSLQLVNEYLEIKTPIKISSSIPIDNKLKGEQKVLEICKARGAKIYINPAGGVHLYNKATFLSQGVQLFFIKNQIIPYRQFNNNFVPQLSIIDVMMFNAVNEIHKMLDSFELG